MVKVSILLTSYNHQEYIKKSIDSILNQTFQDYELIIVDDCSSDKSWNIISKYKDKRIRKIRHKENIGSNICPELINTFNGEYIAIAHSDDMWEYDKLEKQVNFLDNNKEYAACFTGVKLIDELDQEISTDKYLNFNVKNKNRYEWLNYFFYHGNCLCHPSILMRTIIQKNEELYANCLGSLPDMYRWVKLCLNHEIYVYPEQLTCFRIRRGGLNTSGYNYCNNVRISFDTFKLLELYKKLSDEDFVKVFPQTFEYKKNNYFNKEYALARICLDEVGLNNYNLFGLNILYDLLQDNTQKENLKKYYDYTTKKFINETGNNDVFNIINYDKVNISSLYYSLGENYNEINKITKRFMIRYNNTFDVIFNNLNLKVKGIRFDPIEGKFRKYSDIKIYINGKIKKFRTNADEIENNIYYFYTLDPWFDIDYKGKIKTLYISGKCEKIDLNDALKYIVDKAKKDSIKRYKEIEEVEIIKNNKNDNN